MLRWLPTSAYFPQSTCIFRGRGRDIVHRRGSTRGSEGCGSHRVSRCGTRFCDGGKLLVSAAMFLGEIEFGFFRGVQLSVDFLLHTFDQGGFGVLAFLD